MEAKWNYETLPQSPSLATWAKQHDLNYGVAIIAASRAGYTASQMTTFLHPDLAQLRDPYLLHDMDKTVKRIKQAVKNGERITVYGDYDADGITSTSVMTSAIQKLGGDVHAYIPNRFKDGYGPNAKAFQKVIDQGTNLIITVDNGIVASPEVIKVVDDANVDLIITDHHEFADFIPKAYAIVHASYPGAKYPFEGFCGAGIAFKVSCALLGYMDMQLLQFAAIGTVSDVMELTDENRAIVHFGLKEMEHTKSPGLRKVLENSKLVDQTLTSESIGFQIGPQLNALGRLGDAKIGVKLLLTDDAEVGGQIADFTMEQNQKRKEIGAKMTDEATEQAKQVKAQNHVSLVLQGEEWHRGIVGIVAGHMTEEFNCPAIVLGYNEDNGYYTGSGRSVDGFNLFDALDNFRKHMVGFGGHAGACGLTIKKEEIPNLQKHLDEEFLKQTNGKVPVPEYTITAALNIDDIDVNLCNQVAKLGPFGEGNQNPIFEVTNARVLGMRKMGKDLNQDKFFKISLGSQTANNNTRVDCVCFKDGPKLDMIQRRLMEGQHIHIIGTLAINKYNGYINPQVMVTDWQLNHQKY